MKNVFKWTVAAMIGFTASAWASDDILCKKQKECPSGSYCSAPDPDDNNNRFCIEKKGLNEECAEHIHCLSGTCRKVKGEHEDVKVCVSVKSKPYKVPERDPRAPEISLYPETFVTIDGRAPDLVLKPGEVPDLGKFQCPIERPMPVVSGSADPLSPPEQSKLDSNRAAHTVNPTIKIWAYALRTVTTGFAAIWCEKAPKGAETARARTEPQIGVAASAEHIELRGTESLPVLTSDTTTRVSVMYGGEFSGAFLHVVEVGYEWRQGWYIGEMSLGVAWSPDAPDAQKLGGTVTLAPIGYAFGDEINLKAAIRGGLSAPDVQPDPWQFRLAGGIELEVRPFEFAYDGFWGNLLVADVGFFMGKTWELEKEFGIIDVVLKVGADFRF